MAPRAMWPVTLATGLSAAAFPEQLPGSWSGAVETSILGPQQGAMATTGSVEISLAAEDGSHYIRQLGGSQLFRVKGDLMQYCFAYGTPYAEEATFQVAPSDDVDELKFCWRGPRLPTHAAGCSGCSCAQWTLTLDGDRLQSKFLMSPPAVHLSMGLSRTGQAQSAEQVRAGWNCKFDNYTGVPNDQISPTPPPVCPMRQLQRQLQQQQQQQAAMATAKAGQLRQCARFNDRHDVRLEYEPEHLPCSPCKVSFSLSANGSASDAYLALGFKDSAAAYRNVSEIGRELPNYWGMATDRNTSELSDRIFVTHVTGDGHSCFRHFHAGAYVGVLNPVADDGVIKDAAVSSVGGRTELQFSVSMHLGGTPAEIAWNGPGFGSQRFMWAIGPLTGDGCDAQVGYHGGARALAELNFFGFGTGYACGNHASMLDTDAPLIL